MEPFQGLEYDKFSICLYKAPISFAAYVSDIKMAENSIIFIPSTTWHVFMANGRMNGEYGFAV